MLAFLLEQYQEKLQRFRVKAQERQKTLRENVIFFYVLFVCMDAQAWEDRDRKEETKKEKKIRKKQRSLRGP